MPPALPGGPEVGWGRWAHTAAGQVGLAQPLPTVLAPGRAREPSLQLQQVKGSSPRAASPEEGE